ncbi:MAG: ABC transporter ATP-binding protein [Patescibacteria group bacterium]|nr:ABC transporter ATP-binding protein [Patescibacteria group bacterium]
MNTINPIIETKSLIHSYNSHRAVDNLNLRIYEGEIFGFLGHNGAGKTTTINILTTLLRPSSGLALVAGYNTVTQSLQVRQQIGYLPENVTFYNNLTAFENLSYFAHLSGVRNVKQRIAEVLDFLDFRGIENKKLGEFSKGMRQRIGIAQAIVHEPKVLFLDEPTSGLDPVGIKKLREIIIRLNRERRLTIFMNTHLLSEVAKTCTSIGVLNHGKLIYKNTLEHTLNQFPSEVSLEEIYVQMEVKSES